MITIIEDFLCDIIDQKLLELQTNPAKIDEIFSATSSSIPRFKSYMTANKIKVLKAYPRTPADLPSISVVLANDEETQEEFGDYDLGDTGMDNPEFDTQFENSYRIEIWANNADLVVFLYYICKWIFMSSRDYLVQNVGLYRQKLGGADFQPAPNWFPEFVYRRAMTFWCQNSISAPTGDIPGDISAIQTNQTIVDDGGGF